VECFLLSPCLLSAGIEPWRPNLQKSRAIRCKLGVVYLEHKIYHRFLPKNSDYKN
jgi:hypothetical protein